MPSPELRGAIAKAIWAEEHFKALDAEILSYLKLCRDRTRLPTRINPERSTVRLTFEPIDPAPVQVSLRIGDCLHNIKCSLDHLWKCLGGEGNFPMHGGTKGCGSWNAQKRAKLLPIPVGAHAVIDALQPCRAGGDAPLHPLAILNTLANHDKHQNLHITWPRSRNNRIAFREKGSHVDVCVITPTVVFHEQTEFVVHDVPPGLVKPNMDVNIRGNLFVSFRNPEFEWKDAPVQEVLWRCIHFVKQRVFDELGQFAK